jgi:hypothetical protein
MRAVKDGLPAPSGEVEESEGARSTRAESKIGTFCISIDVRTWRGVFSLSVSHGTGHSVECFRPRGFLLL